MCIGTTRARNGEKYIVTFIDDYTRFGITYLIRAKSDVLESFQDYKRKVECQHGKKIKVLRTDNGGEYVSKEFDKVRNGYGIRRQLTIPETPQQNGVAERRNRTLAETTRCLLLESKLPKSFWGDAITCATHLKNRCPSRSIDGKIPYELWFGRTSNIDHLKVFGCQVFYKGKARSWKFEAKWKPGIFLGYSPFAKAYLIWNETDGKVILSRDTIFNENKIPAITDKTTKIADDKEIVPIPILEESEEDDAKEQENASEDEESVQEEVEESFDQRPIRPLQRPASITGRES